MAGGGWCRAGQPTGTRKRQKMVAVPIQRSVEDAVLAQLEAATAGAGVADMSLTLSELINGGAPMPDATLEAEQVRHPRPCCPGSGRCSKTGTRCLLSREPYGFRAPAPPVNQGAFRALGSGRIYVGLHHNRPSQLRGGFPYPGDRDPALCRI